jgi:hypothetical protein
MALTLIIDNKNYSSWPLGLWLADEQVEAEIIQAFEA